MGRLIVWGRNSNEFVQAFYAGGRSAGYPVRAIHPNQFKDKRHTHNVDAVAVLGWKNHSRYIAEFYMTRGIPVFVHDAAYILRDQGYFQLGLNGLNSLPPTAPHDRAKDMGLIAGTKRKSGSHILVCGQVAGDAQPYIDVEQWKYDTLDALNTQTDYAVTYRPHPKVQRPECTLQEALADCHCMVTHNSTAAYEAIMAGVPVVCDPCAVYADVCETDLSRVENPRLGGKAARQRLLDRVAYGQWTLGEMRSGKALQILLETINAQR
jgi:hypothetical protein